VRSCDVAVPACAVVVALSWTVQVEYGVTDASSLARACRNANLEMVRWLVADVGVDPSAQAGGEVRWVGDSDAGRSSHSAPHSPSTAVACGRRTVPALSLGCGMPSWAFRRCAMAHHGGGRRSQGCECCARVAVRVLPLTLWSRTVCRMCAARGGIDGGGVRGQLRGCCAMACGGGSRSDGGGGAVAWRCALGEHRLLSCRGSSADSCCLL
jgi:hypothetical protein